MNTNPSLCAKVSRLEPVDENGYLVAFWAQNVSDFEATRLAVRSLPSGCRRWLPEERAWWIALPALLALALDWPNLAGELVRLRGAESGKSQGDPHTERSHTRRPTAATPKHVAAAFATLCLTPSAPVGLVTATRRFWAKQLHPDHAGGDTSRMQQINDAADVAGAWAETVAERNSKKSA